jgi:class 3 adenylate cyclase
VEARGDYSRHELLHDALTARRRVRYDGAVGPTAEARFEALEEVGGAPEVVAALRRLVEDGSDDDLLYVDPLEIAAQVGVSEHAALDVFLHAARLGVFDMAWNIVCPDCGGVLSAALTLRKIQRREMGCSLCDRTYECDLDQVVAVTFTVHPQVRAIRGHHPERFDTVEFMRWCYLGPTLSLPRGEQWLELMKTWMVAHEAIPPHGKTTMTAVLEPGWMIVQIPNHHSASIIEITGEPKPEQHVTIEVTHAGTRPSKLVLAPGPATFVIDNRTEERALGLLQHANDALHDCMSRRKPYLTGKQVVTNQTFRNLFRANILELDQSLQLRDLTIVFTDLRGSTQMYERIGDLAAFDLVRRHFGVLGDVVRNHGGSIVKTIGDAVMASFPTAGAGMAAALGMRDEMARFNVASNGEDLVLKIGLHAGPCLAVWSNDRLDFFGQTVNIAARVQAIAAANAIVATAGVMRDDTVAPLLAARGLSLVERRASLRGIAEQVTVFELA